MARKNDELPTPHEPDVPNETKAFGHAGAGIQCTSHRFVDTLVLEGVQASIDSIGDCLLTGLSPGSPFRHGQLCGIADVEPFVANWVTWDNTD